MNRSLLLFALALALSACGDEAPRESAGETEASTAPVRDVADASDRGQSLFDADRFASHVETLSSDEFLGRPPTGPGSQRTMEYIADRMAQAGVAPGNGDSWYQEVPLVGITLEPGAELAINGLDEPAILPNGEDAVLWTKRVTERVSLQDSELVFVGYGIVAPEYGWNDYAGLDVAGKTVVMLVNDPGYATRDPALFEGNAMTYYGRWTYKYEEAARQGAAGAIVIHETGPAGYPWGVVTGSWTGTQFSLDGAQGPRVKVEGWITDEVADRLFGGIGSSFDEAKARALAPDFEPVAMGLTASAELVNSIERTQSRNVVGVVRGSERPQESVVYMAHWDHLGNRPDAEGDGIYNGAVDNATGIAALIEIARRFAGREQPPARSVVFLAVTAEEQGLLGSQYYAEDPLYPLETTAGSINMDGMSPYGKTRDMVVVGHGSSEMEDILARYVAQQGRRVEPEPTPEKGFYFRSDHFNFAKKGVPSLYAEGGIDMVEGGEERGRRLQQDYTENRYHKPSDEYDPETWNFAGILQDAEIYYRVGAELADSEIWPQWREGNAFRSIRQQSAQQRAGNDQ